MEKLGFGKATGETTFRSKQDTPFVLVLFVLRPKRPVTDRQLSSLGKANQRCTLSRRAVQATSAHIDTVSLRASLHGR